MTLIVRPAVDADAPSIQAIYAFHVLNGRATFEEKPPSVEEIARRQSAVAARGLPWRVAEVDGEVLAYAYAGPFRERSAYRFTIEDSVYLARGCDGRGLGSALLAALIERCEGASWRQMVAVIGDSDNHASRNLHRKFGFRHVGTLERVGFKFGRWLDSVLMQRALAGREPVI